MVADYRQIVKRFYRLYAIKDIAAAMDLFDPQVEMHPAENFIYATGKPYIGPDAICDCIFTRMDAEWEVFTATADEILGAGEVVIARGRYRGTSHSGNPHCRSSPEDAGRGVWPAAASDRRYRPGSDRPA